MAVHLQKYPVISAEGNEYLVEVYNTRYTIEDYTTMATVFKKKKNWRGKTKFREVYESDLYSETKWEYDYVAMAKDAVKRYEDCIRKIKGEKKARAQGAKQFEEWDGDCE